MESGSGNDAFRAWRVEEIRDGSDTDASLDVTLGLYEQHNRIGRFRFQFNKSEDGVGTIYLPGRWGSSFDDRDADRDNRAAFEAAQVVAEETGTRAETFVSSQEYLDSVSRESLSGLIGEVGEERARELLEQATDE